jgi:AraC family transcriptional regulator, regulatory protein of adaptative response / methylated-DNA-[protein]-cysteine methyltransferase
MHSAMTIVNNSDARWNQVLARNLNADGEFVYAVKSTGIFCRPSCPSRRPRREQVEFFDSPQQAQRAGYRACRRCTPLQQNAQLARIEKACRYIEQNLDVTLSLEALSRHAGLSPFHFQRLFKRTLGISPRQYQQARRAGKFRQALQTESRITDAIYEAGYSSSSRAYENSNERLGMTPSTYRRNGAGAKISYSVVSCELGRLLVAATERGLCAVRFGDKESSLQAELRDDFSAAEIRRDDRELKPLADQVLRLLSEPVTAGAIPLDIQGTAFQQRVWNALRQIPRGETRSYAQIATKIGKPEAVRAVANACASNPVAVVIPCHRVVQKNGSLAGYRWGVERKAALLRAERPSVP